jgi:OOP family OmpA-OmpF porin
VREDKTDAEGCKKKFEDNMAAAEAKSTYKFGQLPAPEPLPPAAPAPIVHSIPFKDYYRVGFRFDKTTIIPEGQEVLRQAIRDAEAHPDLKIAIRAHADRAGSDEYNLKLSQRRADAILSKMAAGGISADRLKIVQAVGESRPLVPTADGVKEQANRVVEIDLRFYNR